MDELSRNRRASLLPKDLADAELARYVEDLGTDGIRDLVAQVGLADAGTWLAVATPAQVVEVLDSEVWREADERFDPRQFAVWLEALLDAGADLAADRLADAPEDLVVLGLCRHALVFDTHELWLAFARAPESPLLDKVLDGSPSLDLGEQLLVSRGLDGWDALVAVLLALEDRHPELLARVLGRCHAHTEHAVEELGLQDALEADDEAEEEAAVEREDRRARRGYVAPHVARSFLALALAVDLEDQLHHRGRDPVTAAYFRDWARETGPGAAGLVVRGGVRSARAEELGYLVQVVMVGCETRGRPFTVAEAAEAVLAVARLGEAVLRAHDPAGGAPVDVLFRLGYHLLDARVVRLARRRRDATGLADAIPWLGDRFVGSLADLDAAEALLDR